MKVYIVISSCQYEPGFGILACYTSQKKAMEHVAAYNNDPFGLGKGIDYVNWYEAELDKTDKS